MAKTKSVFVCSECGAKVPKWQGKCNNCGNWDTFIEEIVDAPVKGNSAAVRVKSAASAVKLNEINSDKESRYKTGLKELDRVLGGGIVKGSLVLLSGDPGIGKSTLILQMCEYLGKNLSVLYVAGEESKRQLKLRADRLGVTTENLSVLTETDVETVNDYIYDTKPDIVMIDSIQTMAISAISSVPGSVAQVRECTNAYLHTAKSLDIPIIIVGHVNKDGAIAGPKVLEHIVDAVLYFEGEKNLTYRMLRAVKNRFGSTNEIGVFEMCDKGLKQVQNPSAMLISGRPKNVPGTCVACVLEGTRPVLAEVQGLVTATGFGNPRRMSTGFDYNRLNLLLAVLEKRVGFHFSSLDAYVNIVGGLKLAEPAVDLPIVLSLISSLKDTVIREDVIAFGEIGLAGEVRTVVNAESRILEAARLGFKRCIIPIHNLSGISEKAKQSIEVVGVRTIKKAFEAAVESTES
ncbi:MAG: DNA repair protein RadA [Acutalibacteraceae bacterium]|nr:DNA repair protein RadA [Acutalibacteraceae bacterium]